MRENLQDTFTEFTELLEEANNLKEKEIEILFESFAVRDKLFDKLRESFKNNEKINKTLIVKAKNLQKNIKETQANIRYLAEEKRNLEGELEILKN